MFSEQRAKKNFVIPGHNIEKNSELVRSIFHLSENYDLEKFSTDILIISFLQWKTDFAKKQRPCCNLDFFLLRLYYLLEYNVRNPLLHHQRTDLCLMRKSFGFRCVKSYVSQWNNSQGTNMTSNSETHCWSNFVSECVCQPCQ